MAQIGHNPYELISYLTALYMDFTFDDVKQPLDDLFEQQYILTLTSQTETRTDDEGNDKEYKILNVTLVNKKKATKKLEKKKYCKFCDKHTLHKECK